MRNICEKCKLSVSRTVAYTLHMHSHCADIAYVHVCGFNIFFSVPVVTDVTARDEHVTQIVELYNNSTPVVQICKEKHSHL